MLFLSLIACHPETHPDTYEPITEIGSDGGGAVEEVGSGATVPCTPDEIDPYDPVSIVSYTLDIDDTTLAMLDALGYGWWTYGTTYDQISMFAASVTVEAPGCEPIVFEEPRVDTGRQMGWQSPYGEASWIVEYNEIHGDQELGGYDDARYWAPTYDGPVNEMWVYEYVMDYVGLVSHRRASWMKFRTTWWGNQQAIYNALEPIEDDYMTRVGANALWEGYDIGVWPGGSAVCKAGACDDAGDRASACYDRLMALSDPDALIAETGDCYDWAEIAQVMAVQDWFSHWDGCGSNNCFAFMSGNPDDPSAWKVSLGITGIDLLLSEEFTPVELTDFVWTGGTAGWYCKADASEGGCRDQYAASIRTLSDLARNGTMEQDLRTVYALRQSDGVALDGDDAWVESSVAWVTERPDYADAGLEALIYPCGRPDTGDTALDFVVMGGGVIWETGGYVDPCAKDTAADTGWIQGGGFPDTGH